MIIDEPTFQGSMFEIDPNGKIVWEFINRCDKDRVIMTHEGTRLPSDYFKVADWSCH